MLHSDWPATSLRTRMQTETRLHCGILLLCGIQNFCKVLKKGSSVTVVGDPTERIYTSQKTGMPEIGRDIKAFTIGFNPGGLKKDDESEAEQGQSAPQPAAAVVKQPQAQPNPQPKQTESAQDVEFTGTNDASEADDLPF